MNRSIQTIKSHLAHKAEIQETMYVRDIEKIMNALEQFENDQMDIVGIGYLRYDNHPLGDFSDGSKSYEGGFIVIPRVNV